MSDDKPRLEPIDPDEIGEDIRRYTMVPGGAMLNIFRTLSHHPKLVKRWLVFSTHVLAKSTLPPRDRELLILRTGWRCGSEYEFGQHTLIGKATGLSDDEVLRCTKDADAQGWDNFDALLMRATDELVEHKELSDATWEQLSGRYSDEQKLDLIFAVGNYTLVCMALKSLRVQRDPGVPGFPK